jgi:Flp pilus assembly protein TadB
VKDLLKSKNLFEKKHKAQSSHPDMKRAQSEYASKVRRLFMIRHIWIYPFCMATVFFLSDAFLPYWILRITLSIILSIFPFLAIISLLYGKRKALLRSQSKVLLQSLCTSVSGGFSLESAFLCARPTLEKAFGKRSLMAQSLQRLEKSLSAHVPLSTCLTDLCHRLDYIELLPIMHALSIARVVGNGVISILRNSCQMLSELMAVSGEVEANNAGRNAEAFILCLMPFGITFTLSTFTNGYMNNVKQSPLGISLMLLAFCIAVISCGFLFALISDNRKSPRATDDSRITLLPFPQRFIRFVRGLLLKIMPESYLTRQFELFSELTCEPEKLFDMQIRKIMSLVLITVPVFGCLLFYMAKPLYYLFPAECVLIFLIHHDMRQRVVRRRESLMEEIPLFLSMLVTLLQSRVLLPKAIETCSDAFSDTSSISYEIQVMKAQMLSGMSAGASVESLSSRTPIPEAQAALLLASRYECSGGTEVLSLLTLQSTACWSLCRNASRKKRERDALAMVLPMMLDLISVLLVAITPALLSLRIT